MFSRDYFIEFGSVSVFFRTLIFKLIQKRIFQNIDLGFAQTTSQSYRNNFKAAIEKMKKNRTVQNKFPKIIVSNSFATVKAPVPFISGQ